MGVTAIGVHRKAAALVVDNRLVAADHAATLKLLHARLHGGHGQACRLGKVGQRGSAILFKHVEDYAIGRVELARNRTCVYRTIVTVGHPYPFPTIHCTGRNRPSPLQFHVLFLPYHTHYRAHTVAESPQFIRTAQRCHEISLFYLAHTPISTIYIFPIYLFSSYFYLFFN